MSRFATPALERPDLLDALRRRPWLTASLVAHAALAACLYAAGPVRVDSQRGQDVRVQVDQSLQQTTRREMRRQLRTMEEIRDALAESGGVKPAGSSDGAPQEAARKAAADDPLAQARRLAAEIETVQQRIRAAEMARVLRIPEQAALRRVRAEDARRPKPVLAQRQPPEAAVAQLAAQARAALAQRRVELLAQRQGVAVRPAPRTPQGTIDNGSRGGMAAHGVVNGKTGKGREGKGAAGSPNASGNGGGRGLGGDNHTGLSSASIGSQLDALATGLALGTPAAITGSSLDMSSSAFSDTRSFGAYLAAPPLDAARVRAGGGRTLGAGGPYANRVHLDTWYVIGPFEGEGGASQQIVYPPERGVDLDAVYYGKNRLPVRWTFQQDSNYPNVPLPRAENAVYYAWTEVMVDADVDLWVSIGADDDSKMWFNERLVWISGDGDKPWYRQPFYRQREALATRNLSEGQRKLHFRKGRNTILFKLYNGVNLMFFSVVLSRA